MGEITPFVSLLAAWLVGATLVVAGIAKMRSPARFAAQLESYSFIPGPARRPLAWALPTAELLLGAVIIAGVERVLFAPAAAALFLAFALILAVTFGPRGEADCGCFGAAGTRTKTSLLLGRNLALAVLAAVAWAGANGIAVGSLPLLIAFSAAVLALTATYLGSSAPRPAVPEQTPVSADRRRFLRLAVSAVAGAVAATSLGTSQRTAEAACGSCGSCGYDYIFSYCIGSCCAVYWVRPYKLCSTSCSACSGYYQTYCNIPSCC